MMLTWPPPAATTVTAPGPVPTDVLWRLSEVVEGEVGVGVEGG